MAAEEPTHGELARRLDSLHADLRAMAAGLVGRAEYVADQKAIDQRFQVVHERLDDVRRQHAEDIRAVNERVTGGSDARTADRQSWRGVLWTGLLPAIVVLVMGVITIYVSAHH
jgi:hypothetical protein